MAASSSASSASWALADLSLSLIVNFVEAIMLFDREPLQEQERRLDACAGRVERLLGQS